MDVDPNVRAEFLDLSAVRRTTFAGGERHCFFEGVPPRTVLRAQIKSSDDLMDLLLVTDVFREHGRMPEYLHLPYMPAARQDRYTAKGHPFSLRVYADLINSLGYEHVCIYEPHSDVTAALVKNCVVRTFDDAVARRAKRIIDKSGCTDLMLFAPDAGAEKRTYRAMQHILSKRELLGTEAAFSLGQAIKHRDPSTGKIAQIEVVTKQIEGREILVLDDICDGGRTFNMLAEELLKHKPRSLHLFVAHGIFSADDGVDTLLKYYDTIATTTTVYDGRFGDKVRVYYGL